MRLRHPLLALVCTFIANSAQGFFDEPYITPASPAAGQAVSINARMGICDSVIQTPGYPQISQDGTAIRIVMAGNHVTFQDFCIYPANTATYLLGDYPAGDYSLTVDFLYDDALFGPTIIPLGVVPFTVRGTPVSAVPAPADSGVMLSTLAVTLLIAAWKSIDRTIST